MQDNQVLTKTQVVTVKSGFLLRMWTSLVSLAWGQQRVIVFNTGSICVHVGTKHKEVKMTSKSVTSFDRAQQEKRLRKDTVQYHILSVPQCPYTDACNISKGPEALAEWDTFLNRQSVPESPLKRISSPCWGKYRCIPCHCMSTDSKNNYLKYQLNK